MKKNIKLFICILLLSPAVSSGAHAAVCSKMNLTRCLDSACAINISSNPAARCQLCGTSSAGTISANTGMKRLSVGQSAATTLSDTELKSAPSDPGARYAWATAECIKKIDGCVQQDVMNVYDTLIEQSCKAAGINAQMAALQSSMRQTKSATTCSTDIQVCLNAAARCGPDFSGCTENSDFDKFFAVCAVEVGSCGDYISKIRTDMIASRNSSIKNKDSLLANIVAAYQTARDNKLKAAQLSCTNNKAREDCIKDVCAKNMRNKCAVGFASERSMATQLCKFHDIACNRLK